MNFQSAWDSLVKSVAATDPARADAMQATLDRVIGAVGGVTSREEFFSELGTQMALFVIPAAEQKGPPAAAIALQLRNTDHIPNALESIVGLGIMAAQQQGRDASLEHSEYKNAQLSTVHPGARGPLGKFSPTFGVVGGYLVIATTLDAAHSVVDAAQTSSAPVNRKAGTPFAQLTVSVPQVRAMLQQYSGFLVQQSTANGRKTAQQAQHDMQALDQVLSLLQSIQTTQTFGPGRTDHYLTIELAASRP
jgi:hypothetical protein